MKTIFLKTAKDAERISRDCIVQCDNAGLLAGACAKAAFVNPIPARGFFKDEALVRAAADNKCVFVIPLGVIVNSDGSGRARLLRELRFFLRLCLKLKAKFFFTNELSESKFDLKNAREAQAIGVLLGLTLLQARAAFKNSLLG